MQVVLVMFRPDGQRRSFSVVRDMTVVGRREDCDLRIPLGDVSRKHCRLIKEGDAIRVEDLGSSNGTYRNANRVQQSELTAGDTLQVGPVVFVLQVDGMPADEDLQPVTSAAAGATTAEEDLEVVESGELKEFDPMEALNAGDGSGFEFLEEEAAAAAAGVANDESDLAMNVGDPAPAGLDELGNIEDAPVALDDEPDDEPVELDAVEEAPVEEAPVELEESNDAIGDIVDLEESENGKKS